MRNIIRIGAGTDGRNRFVAIALGVALAAGPAVALPALGSPAPAAGPAAALAAPATDAAAASTTAGTTITLQGADGASLAGHTFDVYRIGTYTDQILNGTRISSLGVRGDTASNAWAADAIGIANAYDPSTADDIGKVYGYDDAGNIANIKMDSQTMGTRTSSRSDIPSGMVPSGRHTTTSSPPPSSSVSLQMPVPSTDSRYSPSSGIPSRVNLHMRSPCPSIDPPIMPDARHIPSSCYFLSSVHESDTPSSPSGDDGPLPGCRPKMDSPSPNAPRDRSSPSNRSRSACSRSSRSQIS